MFCLAMFYATNTCVIAFVFLFFWFYNWAPSCRSISCSVARFTAIQIHHIIHWSQYFPRVEWLNASFSSRKQIRFLIDQSSTMLNESFHIYNCYIDPNERMKITYQWLRKHISRRTENTANNFICQVNDRFVIMLSVYLWFGDRNWSVYLLLYADQTHLMMIIDIFHEIR